MIETILPHDMISNSENHIADVIILPYHSNKASVKSRIILECHVFSFLLEGEKIVSYASGTKSIKSSSFFFLPAGNCLVSEKVAENGNYRSLLFFVSKKALSSFFKSFPSCSDAKLVQKSNWDKSPVVFSKDNYIESFIASLELIIKENLINSTNDFYKLKLEELLLYLLNKNTDMVSYFKELCEEWDEDALLRKTVNTHIESSITVEELAFLCNMSVSTFKRKFAKVFGDSPKQWFFKKKMMKAAELLKNDGIKASEIYDQFGYENLSSFVQSFKQVYGITPKQFQISK
jgi:AraC family transcriptional regulator, exoenzyme S synthesis regulatory protein ExsA